MREKWLDWRWYIGASIEVKYPRMSISIVIVQKWSFDFCFDLFPLRQIGSWYKMWPNFGAMKLIGISLVLFRCDSEIRNQFVHNPQPEKV